MRFSVWFYIKYEISLSWFSFSFYLKNIWIIEQVYIFKVDQINSCFPSCLQNCVCPGHSYQQIYVFLVHNMVFQVISGYSIDQIRMGYSRTLHWHKNVFLGHPIGTNCQLFRTFFPPWSSLPCQCLSLHIADAFWRGFYSSPLIIITS